MANGSKRNLALILLTIVSIILSVIPVIVWIRVFNANARATQEQKQKLFLQTMPFTNLNTVSYFMLVFAIVAIVASAMWRKRSAATEKIIATIALVVSFLLTVLFLFQLM